MAKEILTKIKMMKKTAKIRKSKRKLRKV